VCEVKRTQALVAPPPVLGAAAHLHLKGQTQKRRGFANPQKVTILTCYIIISVGYFELELHIHPLGHQILILYLVKRALYHPFNTLS